MLYGMYSLVSAPVLGFDLVRRPTGSDTAALLAIALELRPADLPALAGALRPDHERAGAWAMVTRIDMRSGGLREVAERTRAATGPGATLAALRGLETTAIGTLEDLLRFVRHEVFEWAWEKGPGLAVQDEATARAVSAVCDAVAATAIGPDLSTAHREVLLAPWRSSAAVRALPHDLGPGGARVHLLLDRVRRMTPAEHVALRSVSEGYRKGTSPWAMAVHNASWAAHLSDRTRVAAQAQLLAVVAAKAAGLSTRDSASGGWNLLSGAVHALMVADLLADEDVDALVQPVTRVFGPLR